MTVFVVQDTDGAIHAIYATLEDARAAAPDQASITPWPIIEAAPMSPELRDRLRAQYGAEIHKT